MGYGFISAVVTSYRNDISHRFVKNGFILMNMSDTALFILLYFIIVKSSITSYSFLKFVIIKLHTFFQLLYVSIENPLINHHFIKFFGYFTLN